MPEVAEAHAPETTNPAAGGTGSPVPSTPQVPAKESTQVGLFDHLKIEKPKTEAKKETENIREPNVKESSEKQAEKITASEYEKLFAGQYKTPEEYKKLLEKKYFESSSEGYRLHQEQKSMSEAIKEREAKLQELEDHVKLLTNQSAFKELNKEELTELAGKDPIAAAEYVAEKKLRDRDLIQAKQKLKEDRERSAKTIGETRAFILGRGEYMASQPEKFPHFESLIPNMEKMRDIMGDHVKDQKWAPDIVYLAALGQLHIQTLQKGAVSTDEASKKAAAESKAIADSSAPGGTPSTPLPSGKEDPNSDKSVKERILKAAPGHLFAF